MTKQTDIESRCIDAKLVQVHSTQSRLISALDSTRTKLGSFAESWARLRLASCPNALIQDVLGA